MTIHPIIRTSDDNVAEFPTEETIAERKATYKAWATKVAQPQPVGHNIIASRADPLHWSVPRKELADSTVALLSTGGVHLRQEPPFEVYEEKGDWSYRLIPGDVNTADLTVTHTHYATHDAFRDVNVMFPLDRLRELEVEGTIGSVSQAHFGFMGFIPDPAQLVAETAVDVARSLKLLDVDLVILTPG